MQRQEVFETLHKILVDRLEVPSEEISMDAHIYRDLGLDSVELLSAIAVVEQRLGIEIPDEDLQKLETLGAAVDFIVSRLSSDEA